MSLAEWADQGRRLGVLGRSAGWWIGDWLTYGNAAYGERYTRASRITGYDVQTLMNMVYVASHIDPSRRRENLSWSHHAEVVGLPEQDQDDWLDRAAQERLSVRCLRQEVRRVRRTRKEAAKDSAPSQSVTRQPSPATAGGDEEDHGTRVVCPSCGHRFAPPDELAPEAARSLVAA